MAPSANDIEHFGVAADEIWKARVEKEKLIATNWPLKWAWIQDEYRIMSEQLDEIRKMQPLAGRKRPPDTRSVKPLPVTSSRMIGWLVARPQFELEIYGPYIKKVPIFPEPTD